MQVSNYSTHWHLEVAWINEDNILIRRGDVPPGSTDFQLVDVGHVWCIIARAVVRDHGHHHVQPKHFSSGEHFGLGIAAAAEEGSPAMLVIKPSRYSLSNNKCSSILWTPFASMSATQRLYLSSKEETKTSTSSGSISNLPNFTLTPHMHIQIFEGVNNNKPSAASTMEHAEGDHARPSSHEGAKLDRVKLSKWPKKGNVKREKALKALRK